MAWFGRRKKDPVPGWWPGAEREWPAFWSALTDALRARGEPVPPAGGRIAMIRQVDGRAFSLDLERVADAVRSQPQETWQGGTSRLLAEIIADGEATRLDLFAHGAEYVRSMLRPQLLLQEALPAGSATCHRPLGAGLVAVLEVAGPETTHHVNQPDVTAWQVDERWLWDVAYANLRDEHVEVKPHGPMSALLSDGPYGAAQVLRLGELLDTPVPAGVVFAVPEAYGALLLPLRNPLEFLDVLRRMPEIVSGAEDLLQPVSPHLYWWCNGVVERVVVDANDDHVEFIGGEGFTASMNRLMAEAAEAPRP
jgi:hypothetical protein